LHAQQEKEHLKQERIDRKQAKEDAKTEAMVQAANQMRIKSKNEKDEQTL
jgi:hypothetical protein